MTYDEIIQNPHQSVISTEGDMLQEFKALNGISNRFSAPF